MVNGASDFCSRDPHGREILSKDAKAQKGESEVTE